MEAGSSPTNGSNSNSSKPPGPKPRRHQVATACVRCRRRKIRCNGRFPCETCLRLRLTCQEPEVKRNPSRASLERRIEQLEALASEAGIDIFSRPQNESAASRNRSISSTSASSNVSHQPLRLETSAEYITPATTVTDYECPVLSASSVDLPLNIPTIEVTASSLPQSPVSLGCAFSRPPAVSGYPTPDLATPALSTGSFSIPASPAFVPPALAEPWHCRQDDNSFPNDAAHAFEHDQCGISRRGSVPANSQAIMMGSMLVPDDGMVQPCQLDKGHLSVGVFGQQALQSESTSPSTQDILDAMDISAFDLGSDPATAQFLNESSIPGVSFNIQYASLLSSTYFQHVHPFFPFLDQDAHVRYVSVVYGQDVTQVLDIDLGVASFQVYIVQAIGARILENDSFGQQSFRENLFSTAMLSCNAFRKLDTIHDVHSALLLLIYSLYCETPEIEPLTLKATITSSCIHLGLHKPRNDPTLLTAEDDRALYTFLSAYILDRTISLALDQPFSLCDDDIEIEELVSQLEIHQQQQNTSSNPYPSILSITAKLNRIISTVHTVQSLARPNSHGIPRLTAPFLTTPTPPTLCTWRRQIFQLLHTLATEFQRTKSQTQHPSSVNDVLSLLINEGILLLLHPPPPVSSGTLDESELKIAGSTARASAAVYRRLQEEKALVPCMHLAKGVFLAGMVLRSGVGGNDGKKKGGRGVDAHDAAEDPDVLLIKGILKRFSEEGVGIAGRLREELEEIY